MSGSHRVVERFVVSAPSETRADYRTCRIQFMKSDPWLRALARTDDSDPDRNARFMDTEHDADGIGVRVVELTGRAGDVVITHPWTLHHSAPNRASYPRLMRSKAISRGDDSEGGAAGDHAPPAESATSVRRARGALSLVMACFCSTSDPRAPRSSSSVTPGNLASGCG